MDQREKSLAMGSFFPALLFLILDLDSFTYIVHRGPVRTWRFGRAANATAARTELPE